MDTEHAEVTVYSQQVRALEFIWALDSAGSIEAKRVVVVGGGIAGVTASAAAILLGAHVTLLERGEEFFTFSGLLHRYLHPRIYEWPHGNARRAGAGLPILNWTVGTASDVATRILADYHRIRLCLRDRYKDEDGERKNFLSENTNVRDIRLDRAGRSISWRGRGQQ